MELEKKNRYYRRLLSMVFTAHLFDDLLRRLNRAKILVLMAISPLVVKIYVLTVPVYKLLSVQSQRFHVSRRQR